MNYILSVFEETRYKEFFLENGFVVIRCIFSAEECDKFLSELIKKADSDFAAIHNIERDPPEGQGLKIAEKIFKDKLLIKILDSLCGAEVVALGNQTLFKEAGTRWAEQAWNPHQDNSYPLTPNGEYTTINIFLADADPRNGGMYIYPGSHKEGLLPFESKISFREALGTNPGNTVMVPEKYKKLDLDVLTGDVLIMHGHVIHGSYPNKSIMRARPLFSVSFVPRGTRFKSGKNNKRKEIEVR